MNNDLFRNIRLHFSFSNVIKNLSIKITLKITEVYEIQLLIQNLDLYSIIKKKDKIREKTYEFCNKDKLYLFIKIHVFHWYRQYHLKDSKDLRVALSFNRLSISAGRFPSCLVSTCWMKSRSMIHVTIKTNYIRQKRRSIIWWKYFLIIKISDISYIS